MATQIPSPPSSPPPGRARTDEAKERRRDDILSAARRVFAEKGYHDTTMADVARAAELSYGLVYWYFDSKEALFISLMDSEELALRNHIDAATAALDPNPRSEEAFRTAVQATFEFFEADRVVAKLLFRDALVLGDRFDRHLAAIYGGFIGDIEKTISSAQESGRVVDAPSRMIAFSVAALISQLALRRLTTDDGVPASVVADFVVTLLLNGLRPIAGTRKGNRK